ncbi:hypothetical protein HK405_010804, partial [Cladochytrium tenue]
MAGQPPGVWTRLLSTHQARMTMPTRRAARLTPAAVAAAAVPSFVGLLAVLTHGPHTTAALPFANSHATDRDGLDFPAAVHRCLAVADPTARAAAAAAAPPRNPAAPADFCFPLALAELSPSFLACLTDVAPDLITILEGTCDPATVADDAAAEYLYPRDGVIAASY